MIPRIYSKDAIEFESNGLGLLKDTIECIVEEERNGLFDLQLIIPVGSFLFAEAKRGNIIKAHASDRLRNQLFRIHDITKPHDGKVKVFANHISFDLAHDFVENINIQNQSCEYALNEIFRQSNFCKHFKGYSNILNSQNYRMSICNCLEAIAGKQGSIIDTFGNGAEVLRDNYNTSVLNSRGNEENVLIAYRKNLTGFELHEDDSNLITRIYPYAKYTEQPVEGEETSGGTNEEITVTLSEKFVDSKRINNYSHPYITAIDFSEKFGENEIPTEEKLRNLATRYFTDNNCDLPKFSYKIEFIPLSKTEEYKDYKFLEDIGMCDKVLIRNSMYDIYDQAKVIKTSYDVINERYKSIELGEPKSTLGDIIKDKVTEGNEEVKDEVKDEIKNEIDKVKDPNTLPNVPVVSLKTGFATVEVSWTYENKNYYTFEVYASQTVDFSPNAFDLVFKGQASTFLHEVKPSQTWYYKVRAVNSYGRATDFSIQVSGTTTKIADGAEYFESAAIKDALIGELRLDRGWVGQLKGTHIDAKNLTVTDSNGKRTLDIDSFGRVNLDVTSLKITNKDVATNEDVVNAKQEAIKNAINDAKDYTDKNITTVSDSLGALEDTMNTTFKDGIVDAEEALRIKDRIIVLERDKAVVDKQYNNLYKNSNLLGSSKTNLKSAYDDYTTKHNDLVNYIDTSISDSKVTVDEKNSVNSKMDNVKNSLALYKQRENEAIDAIGKKYSDDATNASKVYTDAQIKVLNGEISLKATKAEVNDVDKKINDASAEVKIVAGQIANKVSANEVGSIVEQNPSSVRIAFNKIDSASVFIDGDGLNVERGWIKTEAIRPGSDGRLVLEPGYTYGNGWDRNNIRSIDCVDGQIRLKYDADSYVAVGNGAINFYVNSGHSSVFSVGSNGINGYAKFIHDYGSYYRVGDYIGGSGLYCQYPYNNGIRIKCDANDNYASVKITPTNASLYQGSDIRLKENIHYLDEKDFINPLARTTNRMDRIIDYNEKTYVNKNITKEELYNFIKNDLKLCEYNYKEGTTVDLNFIAQDIVDTKIGSLFVEKNEEGILGYNLGQSYISVIIGALQKEMEKREELETKVNKLEDELKLIKEKLGIL